MTNARLEELRSKFQENPRRYFAPFANELRKGGDPGQAIVVCRTHLATQPGHVSGHIVLGQALYEAGELANARDVFTTALDLDPENLIALRTLGEISQVNGEFVAARQWYQRLLDADPRNNEVAQLVKDLPAEDVVPASAESAQQAHAAETTLEDHRQLERTQLAPPTIPVPSFHSGFTGPGRAYKTAEELAEEERRSIAERHEKSEPTEPVEFVEMDAAPAEFVSSTPVAETSSRQPASEQDQEGPIDLVELDSFTAEQPAAEPVAMEMPDERPADSDEPTANVLDFSFAPPVDEAVAEEPPTTEPAPELEIPVEESAEEFDQPRALFAERGFDGPAGDQVGWMLTPSAVESDFESAPENWFDARSEQEQESVAEVQSAQEPVENEHEGATDSWFDNVPGASAVAPAEGVTTEDFWLPPDLSQVRTTPVDAASEPASEPVGEPNESPAVEEMFAVPDAHQTFEAHVVGESFEAPAAEPSYAAAAGAESFDTPIAEDAFETPVAEESFDAPAEDAFDAPIAEDAFEAPVAYSAAEDSVEPIESAPSMEPSTAAAEAEAFEQTHADAVEYFDHRSHDQPDAHDEAPVAEWSEPVAHQAQLEPGVQPDAGSTHSWAPTAAESSPESHEEESQLVMESSPVADKHDGFAVASGVPDEQSYPEPVVGHTPPAAESAKQVAPEPFVTETLAELYLQQGFRDEALSIYRQLVEREPSNFALRDRMAAIEKRESEQPAVMPQLVSGERAASQSVRTFFSKLARRPAVGTAPQSIPPGESLSQPDVPFASAASALANLFAASKPPAADEGAAATLAGAYTNPTGRPSRAADRELSLDHLFRDVPPGGSQTGGMSMDEFYSTPNAEAGSPTEPGEASESPESGGTDIRQFTAWLEGLRKK